MKLHSNEFMTCSLADATVASAVNETRGCDQDPMDLLIALESRADTEWRDERSTGSRKIFVDRYIRSAIDNL